MQLAVSPDGPGKPCKVILGAWVVSCVGCHVQYKVSRADEQDPDAATVTTKDGRTFTGDVLIGADGLKSVVRGAVVGSHFHSAPSGHSAYRALIPAAKVESDPDLAGLGLMDNRITMVNGGDRRIICYPTRNRNLLNFVCALRPCPCFIVMRFC